MKSNKIKYVVVGGWIDEAGIERMIMCLGAFENMNEAYGKAYLYLDDLASNYPEGKMMITTLCDLEGETGFAMYARCRGDKPQYYAYILFNNHDEDNEKEGDANDSADK